MDNWIMMLISLGMIALFIVPFVLIGTKKNSKRRTAKR